MLELCRAAGASTVTKRKSHGDRGDRAQRRSSRRTASSRSRPISASTSSSSPASRPSHIVGPAVHLTKDAGRRPVRRGTTAARALEEACRAGGRGAPRSCAQRYLAADVGITGANFLVAETGSAITVTNEGNAELTQGLPRDPHRRRQHREGGADDGGRAHAAAPAGPLGHRPGVLDLHDASMTGPKRAGRPRRARAASTSSCSTMAARRCWATSCARCCAASAAAPA